VIFVFLENVSTELATVRLVGEELPATIRPA